MKQVFLFLFIFSLNTFSQSIELGNVDSIKKTHFIQEKKELYVFFKDSLSIINVGNLERVSKTKINYPTNNFINSVQLTSLNSEIYFLEIHGGKVYNLNKNNLIRIDKSFTHRMQMNSSVFVHNDTIFKYGGYGFWSMRNLFTYFDNQTYEWSILSPSGSKSLPKGSQHSTIKIFDNKFFVYGGLSLNPFEPLEYIKNNEVWNFDIKNKSWNFLGNTKFDFNKFKFSISYEDKHVFYNQDDDNLYLVDVVNNRIKTYKKKKYQYGLNTTRKSFFYEGVFYCNLRNYSTNLITLTKRFEDDFFGELIDESPLYYNNEKIYYSIGTITFLILLIYLYFQGKKWNLKRNRIISENNHFTFKRKMLPFDDKSIEIIKLLIQSTNEVTLNEIMEVYENKNLNYGHNTRVINGMVEEINFKLKSILGIEIDLITFHKSSSDKRIKVYTIDKTYFFIK